MEERQRERWGKGEEGVSERRGGLFQKVEEERKREIFWLEECQ